MPVQRSGSSKKPAFTCVTTATTGAERSSCTRTVSPLGNTSRRTPPVHRAGDRAGLRGATPYCTIRSTPASALPRMKASASVVGMTTPVSAWPRRARLAMKSVSEPVAQSRSAAFI